MSDVNKPKQNSGNDSASAAVQTSTVVGASDGLISESQDAEQSAKRKDIADLTPEELEVLLAQLEEEESLEEEAAAEKAKSVTGVNARTELFDSTSTAVIAPDAIVGSGPDQGVSSQGSVAPDPSVSAGFSGASDDEESAQEVSEEEARETNDENEVSEETIEEIEEASESDQLDSVGNETDLLSSLGIEEPITSGSIDVSIPELPAFTTQQALAEDPEPVRPEPVVEPEPPTPVQVEVQDLDVETSISESGSADAVLVGQAGELVAGSGDETTTLASVNGQQINAGGTSSFQGNYGVLNVNASGDWSYMPDPLSEAALKVTESQLDDGLVAHWQFDASNNGSSADSALSDSVDDTAVFNGGAQLSSNGFQGSALSLDGNNDRALISDSSDINLGSDDLTERTITLVFRFDENNDLNGRQILFEEGCESGGVVVYLEDQTLYVGVHDRSAGWDGEFLSHDISELSSDEWHHVALVLDSNEGELSAFIDRTSIGSVDAESLSSHPGDISIGGPGEESALLTGRVITSVNFESPDLGSQTWGMFDGNPAPGWTTSSGRYEIQAVENTPPHEGDQWLELDGESNSQDSLHYLVENNDGNSYTLELAVRAKGDTSDIEVYWGDELITTLEPDVEWAFQRIELPSFDGESRELRLQELAGQDDSFGALIDGIRLIENVPSSEDDNGYFQGTIDDVRIYNRALSDAEIEAVRYDFDQPSEHFDYTITNGNSSATGSLDINLSRVPVAQGETLQVTEDSGYNIGQLQAVDGDGDQLSYELVEGPEKGFVTIDDSGEYRFVTGSDFDDLSSSDSEQVSFTYSVTDQQGSQDSATVQVNVTGAEESEPAASDHGQGSLTLDSSYFQIVDGSLMSTEVSGQIVEQDGYTSIDKWHLNHEGGEFTVTLDTITGDQWAVGVRLYQSNSSGEIGVDVGEFDAQLSPDGGSLQVITYNDLPAGHYQLVVGNQGFDESSVRSELEYPGTSSGTHEYSITLSGNASVASLPDDPGQNAAITGETYDQTEGILSVAVVNNDLNMVDADNTLYYEIFNDDVRVEQGRLDFGDGSNQQEISVIIGNEPLETLTLDELQLVFHEINSDGVSVNTQTFDFEQAATEVGEVIVVQGGDGLQGMELMSLGLDYFELGFYEIIDDSQTQGL